MVYSGIFNMIFSIAIIIIFFSPIIASFIIAIYYLVKYIRADKNEIVVKKKYGKRAIIFFLVFILLIVIYLGILGYIAYMIMSTM